MAATVDSAPVYLSNVSTPSGTKNLLFALAKNGRLMAIDAATGTEVWHKTTSGTQPTTASPAIDPNRSVRLQLRHRRQGAQVPGRRRHRDHDAADGRRPSRSRPTSRKAPAASRSRTQAAWTGSTSSPTATSATAATTRATHDDQSLDRRAGRVQHAVQHPHDAPRQRRLLDAPERHLGPRRRDVRCGDRSRLHRDRQRPVQREHGRPQLGRLDARARARRHRRGRRHAARQLHADELPAARRSGHRSRLDLARHHEAAGRQHRRRTSACRPARMRSCA